MSGIYQALIRVALAAAKMSLFIIFVIITMRSGQPLIKISEPPKLHRPRTAAITRPQPAFLQSKTQLDPYSQSRKNLLEDSSFVSHQVQNQFENAMIKKSRLLSGHLSRQKIQIIIKDDTERDTDLFVTKIAAPTQPEP